MGDLKRSVAPYLAAMRHIKGVAFFAVLGYLILRWADYIRTLQQPWSLSGFFDLTLAYDSVLYLVSVVILVSVIDFLEDTVNEAIRRSNDKIVGLIMTYNNQLSLSQLAEKLGMKEGEVEAVMSDLNVQGEFIARISSETKTVTVAPVESFVTGETSRDRLEKLETMFKEGKISKRAYESLKKRYSEGGG